jgi:hypothetical protein
MPLFAIGTVRFDSVQKVKAVVGEMRVFLQLRESASCTTCSWRPQSKALSTDHPFPA